MSANEELIGIAQLAVTLIGFSGLIFVFRARDVTGLEARDLSALAMIVGSGTVALTFALLPIPLAYSGLSEPALWRWCSGLFAATLLAVTGVFVKVDRRLERAGHVQRAPRLNLTSIVLMLVNRPGFSGDSVT